MNKLLWVAILLTASVVASPRSRQLRVFKCELLTREVPRPLAASSSSAAVKQEQRIRFDCLRRIASPQLPLRGFDRRPDPLRRVVG